MEIETTELDLHDTEFNAISEYIKNIANKIAENSDTPAYFKSKEVPHGEMPAVFEADIAELYRACVLMGNLFRDNML